MSDSSAYAAPTEHDAIEEIFPDVFTVHGSIRMAPGMRINRNMVVVRQNGELTIVNPVRLSAQEETALEALGTDWVDPGWGLWLLSHVDLRTTARIRIFRDFMLAALRKKTDLIEGRQPQGSKKSRPKAHAQKV